MMPAHANTSRRPTALFIGHPGHELRVYGWCRNVRPTVFILTDGSGTDGASRLARTTALLSAIGCNPGAVYGRFTDRALYGAMMERRSACFTFLVDEIVESWIEAGIEAVACDASEGYCPTHDLCREMALAAAELVFRQTGRSIRRFEFPLTELKIETEESLRPGSLHIRLDDGALEEKIAAARSYAELRNEVDQALDLKGAEYFRDEWLLAGGDWVECLRGYKPQYEDFGRRRVEQGKYAEVLRFNDHLLPIFTALRAHAETGEAVVAARGA
jgi:hypothetical protein